jgi:hypothetical protein
MIGTVEHRGGEGERWRAEVERELVATAVGLDLQLDDFSDDLTEARRLLGRLVWQLETRLPAAVTNYGIDERAMIRFQLRCLAGPGSPDRERLAREVARELAGRRERRLRAAQAKVARAECDRLLRERAEAAQAARGFSPTV